LFVVIRTCCWTIVLMHSLLHAGILQEQKWIIAVLFMVPVYACESVSTLAASGFGLELT
jgi:hypothetical protein